MVERTKNNTTDAAEDEGKIWWRKIGGGTFRLGRGKIVKPNERFKARPDEIPKGFRDVVIPLSELPEEDNKPATPASTEARFELQSKGGGWYDIINTVSGKPVNSKSLRAKEAQEQLEELQ